MSEDQNLSGAHEENPAASIISNILAVIGFILLAVIIVWGVANVAKLTGFSVAGIFSSSPSVQITAPATIVSGELTTISWKSNSKIDGTYSFLYQCDNSVYFATRGTSGAMNRIPCGTSINVGSSTSATMTPVSLGITPVPIVFSVAFSPENGSAKINGSMALKISPASSSTPVAAEPVKPVVEKPSKSAAKPTTTYHPTGNGPLVAHAASGPADLSVRIIAIGYIDPSSGALLLNSAPAPYDTVGVEFDIANIGGSRSGSYTFAAHLPTVSGYTYNSSLQTSLAPGAHVVNTLRFTQLAPGGIFTVIVSGNAGDTNASNNEAAQNIQ